MLLEDRLTMADKSFYIPGLSEDKQDQWNKTTPSFRILARGDRYPLSDRLHAPHMGPVARAYKFPSFQPAPHFVAPPPVMPTMPMGMVLPPGHYSDVRMPWY